MADTIFVCKHMVGAGYCQLHEEYCHEGPCGDSEPVEYSRVVRGRWIGEVVIENGHTLQECSVCHKLRIVDNYCPNCGAKMDGEADD